MWFYWTQRSRSPPDTVNVTIYLDIPSPCDDIRQYSHVTRGFKIKAFNSSGSTFSVVVIAVIGWHLLFILIRWAGPANGEPMLSMFMASHYALWYCLRQCHYRKRLKVWRHTDQRPYELCPSNISGNELLQQCFFDLDNKLKGWPVNNIHHPSCSPAIVANV